MIADHSSSCGGLCRSLTQARTLSGLIPLVLILALASALTGAPVWGQQPDTGQDTQAGDSSSQAQPAEVEQLPPVGGETTPTTPMATNPKDYYNWWVLAPALVAIFLAIVTRQVVPALVVAVLVGALMMTRFLTGDGTFVDSPAWMRGIRLTFEYYIMGSILDPSDGHAHLKIMVFTLVIGFMIGVIGRNGGTAGMVMLVAGETKSARRGALTAWLAGLVVFFDDYANTMIVGPTMRPVFDRLKISRAKLAYIVDSTAAPVASIALIGTWVGAEIGYIGTGLDGLGDKSPAFLEGVSGMGAFLNSLPYRFYPLLALFLVFLIALLGRDFGPMKRSEAKALARPDEPDPKPGEDEDEEAPRPRWALGLLPVLVLLGATLAILWHTGLHHEETVRMIEQGAAASGTDWASLLWWEKGALIIGNADAYISIFYGAIASAVVALALTFTAAACRLRDTVEAGLAGMARMFPAIVILILAWALSEVSQNLMLGEVISEKLQVMDFPPLWMPLAIFVSAAVISFATGTSWGTMGILCPVVVTVAARFAADLPTEQALHLFYASVGSVLAGAIFGDHCSPISDTTVLSSLASGCPHEEHVWTQIPYALVTAVVAMGLGDVLCSVFGQPWYYGLAAGAVVLLLIVLIIGRRPQPPELPLEPLPPSRAWHRPAARPEAPQPPR